MWTSASWPPAAATWTARGDLRGEPGRVRPHERNRPTCRTGELNRTIQQRYRGERLAREFHERHLNAARLNDGHD